MKDNIKFASPTIEDWNKIIAASSEYNISHSIIYFNTEKESGEEILSLCCYIDRIPVAIICGILSHESNFRTLNIGNRSGGFPLVSDNFKDSSIDIKLIDEFFKMIKERNDIKRIFFYPSFHIDYSKQLHELGFIKEQDEIATLDISKPSDILRKNFSKGCGCELNTAIKAGVKSVIVNNKNGFKQFYDMYAKTMERVKVFKKDEDYLMKRLMTYTDNGLGDIWISTIDDKPVSSAYICKAGKFITFLFAGSYEEYWNISANNKLQLDIIDHYHNLGYKIYNMWGIRPIATIGTSDTKIWGYGKFKLSFGATVQNIYRFRRD